MKITLELWDDQSEISDDTNSLLWVMKLNEIQFPQNKNFLMALEVADKIVSKLLEIEEIAYNDEL